MNITAKDNLKLPDLSVAAQQNQTKNLIILFTNQNYIPHVKMASNHQPCLSACSKISFLPPQFTKPNVNHTSGTVYKRKTQKSSDVCKRRSLTQPRRQNIPDGFWHLISRGSNLHNMWCEPPGVRILFLLSLYCLLSIHVCGASTQFPRGCVCSNYPTQQQETMQSINCSRAGLQFALELNASAIPHNNSANHTGWTNNSQPTLGYYYEPTILYYLDLSHNNLISVKPEVNGDKCCFNRTIQVKVLIFTFNVISEIETGHLSAFTDVLHLDLSQNTIKSVDEDAFVGLETITYLNLSYNSIEDLASNVFQSLKDLRVLDLSHNHIQVFLLDKLPALSSLQYMNLSHNHLQSLTSLVPAVISNLQDLSSLDLSYNNLTQIPSRVFEKMSLLRTLNISNNLIQEVNEDLLKGLNSLEDLILDHNYILSISKPIFKNTSLIRLSIANMQNLSNISHDAFLGLTNLVYLNLSHNLHLSFLQPNLFTALTNLEILDISNSNFTLLSQITFRQNLQQVFICNNPLSCSCTNAWLVTEASKNHTQFINADSLYCLSDNGVHINIQAANFSCDEIFIQNTSSTIHAKLGSQLLFKCQHDTETPSIVMWTTPSGRAFYQHHFHPDASQHLLTPEEMQPDSDFHQDHYWHSTSSYHSELASSQTRVSILSDGSLFIDYMLREDAGSYKCRISNAQYNDTITVNLFAECSLGSTTQIFSYIVGLICAVTFFTLNLIYVIISWTARRLVNKRRREIIRQMLENMNAYKSTQIARIHENYTHQLNRVRNQYHNQCSRLHKNYNCQVTRMKRGCSNQVEKVRDNYNSKLHQLREYSSSQIVQIRERANCQIVRIRDYGTVQLDKLRETYKLQQLHVMKLLDTMNLENCRNIVETECMRAESMMYDIDLLGDDDRTDSPSSPADSEYSTAVSSPSSSLDDPETAGLRRDMSQKHRELSTDSSENGTAIREVQTTIELETRVPMDDSDNWKYDLDSQFENDNGYLMNMDCSGDEQLLQLPPESTLLTSGAHFHIAADDIPSPALHPRQDHSRVSPLDRNVLCHKKSDSDANSDGLYMTPEASPTKLWPETRSLKEPSLTEVWPQTRKRNTEVSPAKVWPEKTRPLTYKHSDREDGLQRDKQQNDGNSSNDNDSLHESIV